MEESAAFLLLSLSSLFLTVGSFRLTLLTQSQAPSNEGNKDEDTNKHISEMQNMMSVLLSAAHKTDKSIPDHPVFRQAASADLTSLESSLSELLGFPIPAISIEGDSVRPKNLKPSSRLLSTIEGNLSVSGEGLCRNQLHRVEPILQLLSSVPSGGAAETKDDKEDRLNTSGQHRNKKAASARPDLASASLVLEMKDIIDRRLWAQPESVHSSPSRLSQSNASFEQSNKVGDEKMKDDKDAQLLASQYLHALNSKMTRINGTLRQLVDLWRRSKVLINGSLIRSGSSPSLTKAVILQEAKRIQKAILEEELHQDPQIREVCICKCNFLQTKLTFFVT